MPLYKFKCRSCTEEYDDFRSVSETEEQGKCVCCGSVEIERGNKVESVCSCETPTVKCSCGCDCC